MRSMRLADSLVRADEFLLDRVFQPLTDRLGERPSAFDVGISLELGAVVMEVAADVALYLIGQLSWSAGLWDGFSCACGMWFYVFMMRQRFLVRPGHANPLRLMYRSLRLLALGFAIWSLFAAATSGPLGALSYAFNAFSNFAFVTGMYFISCQPRPPGWRLAQRKGIGAPLAVPTWS
jgi:hypothetical protein